MRSRQGLRLLNFAWWENKHTHTASTPCPGHSLLRVAPLRWQKKISIALNSKTHRSYGLLILHGGKPGTHTLIYIYIYMLRVALRWHKKASVAVIPKTHRSYGSYILQSGKPGAHTHTRTHTQSMHALPRLTHRSGSSLSGGRERLAFL
jgi:hypothetical protein